MKHIILMADIIDSGSKDPVELMNDFKEIVHDTNNTFKKSIISPLTITLGDEFQGVIKNLETAVGIILFLEEEIIRKTSYFKLRYVLNQGQINTLINNSRAFEMLGRGLTDARENLLKLKENDYRFFISVDNPIMNEILNEAFIIFQSTVAAWKVEKDYELVSHFLKYKDYKKVAEVLHKNRSLIWKREKSLHLQSYYAIKKIIRSITKIKQ